MSTPEFRQQKWESIKAKIDLYVQREPKGSMQDFFATQPKGTRSAYYSYKPNDYVWPNPRSYKGTRNTPARQRSDQQHNRYLKKHTGLKYSQVYELQEKIGLNPDFMPDDWSQKKEEYLRRIFELLNNNDSDNEIPIFELPDYQQETIKAEVKSTSTDNSLAAKIDAILKLGQMIKEL